MVRLHGLHHTGVFVRDLDDAIPFYEDILGMECFLRVEGQAFLRFGRGDEFALFEDPERAPRDGPAKLADPHKKAHAAFAIAAEDYEAAKREFAHRGQPTTAVQWGDHECLYFTDPDGNLLELGGPKAE